MNVSNLSELELLKSTPAPSYIPGLTLWPLGSTHQWNNALPSLTFTTFILPYKDLSISLPVASRLLTNRFLSTDRFSMKLKVRLVGRETASDNCRNCQTQFSEHENLCTGILFQDVPPPRIQGQWERNPPPPGPKA